MDAIHSFKITDEVRDALNVIFFLVMSDLFPLFTL